jgi:hypothetical protein
MSNTRSSRQIPPTDRVTRSQAGSKEVFHAYTPEKRGQRPHRCAISEAENSDPDINAPITAIRTQTVQNPAGGGWGTQLLDKFRGASTPFESTTPKGLPPRLSDRS